MFRKIAIALLFLGIVFPVKADEQPLDLESFGLIPSERKKDMPKGKNPFELVPIEQNSDSKLTQKENYEGIYIDTAKNYMDKKEYETAIEVLNKAIVLHPENSNFYIFRGLSYAGLNQHKKAIDDYTQAINRNSMLNSIYYVRGLSYSELKQYEKAIADYSKSISLDPQESDSYYGRGNSYQELKQCQKAIVDYSRSISLNPKDAFVYSARGYCYNEINDYYKAKLDFIKASELYKEAGDIDSYKDAQESLKTIENNNKNSQQINHHNDEAYYFNLGVDYINKKQYSKAIEFFSQAIKLNPKSALYSWRGLSYFNLKQYQKAILDYTQSLSLDAQVGENYLWRGISYNNIGKYQEAKLDLIKAGQLFSENGNLDAYNFQQKNLKIVEENIIKSSTKSRTVELLDKRTRELLIKRACSMGKQGYTDGEIGNEIYRLVRINTPAQRRTASSFSYGRSYDSTTIAVMNLVMGLDELSAKYYDNVIENEASDIMQVAKKRCKF